MCGSHANKRTTEKCPHPSEYITRSALSYLDDTGVVGVFHQVRVIHRTSGETGNGKRGNWAYSIEAGGSRPDTVARSSDSE
jgi:hypothetical protein